MQVRIKKLRANAKENELGEFTIERNKLPLKLEIKLTACQINLTNLKKNGGSGNRKGGIL